MAHCDDKLPRNYLYLFYYGKTVLTSYTTPNHAPKSGKVSTTAVGNIRLTHGHLVSGNKLKQNAEIQHIKTKNIAYKIALLMENDFEMEKIMRFLKKIGL